MSRVACCRRLAATAKTSFRLCCVLSPAPHTMSFTDYVNPSPTTTLTASPDFPDPTNTRAVAVALTVGIVGILMFALITWLVLRLRRQPQPQQQAFLDPSPHRMSAVTERFRPSFASEASSKLGFKRKSLRLVDQHRDDEDWDFTCTDPDPIPKAELANHRRVPPPLLSPTSPSYRSSSTNKDESNPCSPSTPRSFEIEPPPPVYTRDGSGPGWTAYEPKGRP